MTMCSDNLPPLIMTSAQGSFAQKTIRQRKPDIIDRILSHNDYTPEICQKLLDFKDEIESGQIKMLKEPTSDRRVWLEEITPWQNKTWLEIPWFLAEAYFYRRILEIVAYFQAGPWMHIDPFTQMKKTDILEGLGVFTDIYPTLLKENCLKSFRNVCYKALWGNRGDLSYIAISENDMGAQPEKILINQTEEVFNYLNRKPQKIAYIFDNVGKELFFDLALIDFLIETRLASSITCYLKNQPFFVSDAMSGDFLNTLNHLRVSSRPELRALSGRIKKSLLSGQIHIENPPFFTTARMFRELPPCLHTQIASHDLTILKGDANYRRLFGDRHWHPTTSIQKAGGYFPTSFLSLRTLKAEIAVGLSKDKLDQLEKEAEPDWLINGKRGMITFYQK